MFRFLFSFQGRTSRRGFWLGYMPFYLGVTVAAAVLDAASGGTPVFAPFASLLTLWPSFAVTARRFHDRGLTGWWVLGSAGIYLAAIGLVYAGGETLFAQFNIVGAAFAVFVGLYVLVFAMIAFAWLVYFAPGERGPNRYGPDPLALTPAVEAARYPGPWTRGSARNAV